MGYRDPTPWRSSFKRSYLPGASSREDGDVLSLRWKGDEASQPYPWVCRFIQQASKRMDRASQVLDAEAHDQRNEFVSGSYAVFSGIAMGFSNSSFLDSSNDPSVRRNRSCWL